MPEPQETSRAKHTPGPWSFRTGDGLRACGNLIRLDGNTKVAVANRALIAAAPELLEALQELSDYAGQVEPRPERQTAFEQMVLRARAAIAKATGA